MKTLIYIVRVGFNSTKVRLKENHATEYAWYYKFQFYKSAIKSNKPIAMADVSVLFQFYKSAIKSNKPIAMADVSVLFQFYKSAIKSLGSII